MTTTRPDALDLAPWANTPIGDPERWPPNLRAAAQLCLDYPTPCGLMWGDSAHFLYNASMAESIGVRHPAGMGQPLYDVLPHLWRTIGPLMHEVVRTGKSFAANRFPIQADVGDGVAMYYIDFALVPVRDGDTVVGVLAPVEHRTVAHLEQQRRDVLAAIATVPPSSTRDGVAAAITRQLVTLDDVRFAVLFRPDPTTGRPVRVATSGAVLRTRATRAALDIAVDRAQWPVEAVMAGHGAPVRTAASTSRVGAPRPSWQSAWLAPLPPDPGVRGVLVVGFDERFGSAIDVPPLLESLAAAAAERLAR